MNKLAVIISFLAVTTAGASDWKHVRGNDELVPIKDSAANRNHVLVVNVGEALDNEIFSAAVAHDACRLQVNIWTNSLKESIIEKCCADVDAAKKVFGEKAKLVVFVERSPKSPLLLGSPGAWAKVNIREIFHGSPSDQTLKDRAAKMILKGIGLTAGVCASAERQCTLYHDSLSAEKLDKVGIMITPGPYFPMMETMTIVGGNELTSPVE